MTPITDYSLKSMQFTASPILQRVICPTVKIWNLIYLSWHSRPEQAKNVRGIFIPVVLVHDGLQHIQLSHMRMSSTAPISKTMSCWPEKSPWVKLHLGRILINWHEVCPGLQIQIWLCNYITITGMSKLRDISSTHSYWPHLLYILWWEHILLNCDYAKVYILQISINIHVIRPNGVYYINNFQLLMTRYLSMQYLGDYWPWFEIHANICYN